MNMSLSSADGYISGEIFVSIEVGEEDIFC